MDYDVLLILALTMMAFSIKPGPGMLAVASRALSDRGMSGVAAFMAGNNLAKLIFLLLVIIGYGSLGEFQGQIIVVAKVIAAVFLVLTGAMGVLKYHFESKQNKDIKKIQKEGDILEDFNLGFLITITNPYDIVFFAGIIPSIMPIDQIGASEYWIIFFVMLVADIPVVLSYTLPLRFGREYFKNSSKFYYFNIISSSVLIVAGVIIGVSTFLGGEYFG